VAVLPPAAEQETEGATPGSKAQTRISWLTRLSKERARLRFQYKGAAKAVKEFDEAEGNLVPTLGTMPYPQRYKMLKSKGLS
jgi:hypothetical protein